MFSGALDFTQKWLQESADSVLRGDEEGAAGSPGSSSQLLLNIHNQAYLRLLHWEHGMDTFPEVGQEPLTFVLVLENCVNGINSAHEHTHHSHTYVSHLEYEKLYTLFPSMLLLSHSFMPHFLSYSVYLSDCLPSLCFFLTYVLVSTPACLSVCMYANLPVVLFVYLYICLSYLSVYL